MSGRIAGTDGRRDDAANTPRGLPAAAASAAINPHFTRKYAFIDALRGYAVLLVITTHVGRAFADLPYPVKKLTNFGWYGVQLFFLVSCLTLLLSWRSDEAKGRTSAPAFWARRVFRIAPMYYLGALLYYVIEPPASGFNPAQLLATLAFVNIWHPDLVPTGPGWTVVPGGWSIGVEVTFYMLFPAIATAVRSMRAALLFLLAALALGCAANPLMIAWLDGCCTRQEIDHFIYFWFPNQLPVFALGTVLYHAMRAIWDDPASRTATMLRSHATATVWACTAACVALASLPFPGSLPFAAPLFVPKVLMTSLVFVAAVLALGSARRSPFVNRFVCALGEVSFSA
jgi:peptidoglycan/LPS O-acetylase OafA/YrhL